VLSRRNECSAAGTGGVQIRMKGEAVCFLECSMLKNARLNGHLDEIELGFVEREATPRLLMKLGIQLQLAGLSLSILFLFLNIWCQSSSIRRSQLGSQGRPTARI
jgi:hypothetical protein